MAYNNNIPQAPDQLSNSQLDLLNNFMAIATAFNLNHGDFNGTNQGQHKYCQFYSQTADPTTTSTQVAIYAKGTPAQLYYRGPSNATPVIFGSGSYTNTGTGITSIGTWLLGNMRVTWGYATIPLGTVGVNYNYVTGWSVPAFSGAPFVCQVTEQVVAFPNSNDFSMFVTSVDATSFNIGLRRFNGQAAPANIHFNVLMIGPA